MVCIGWLSTKPFIQNNMKPLKALLVEDSKDDAALLLRHLFNEGYDVQSEIVQTAAEMKAALAERDWDIILSDYTIPHFSGLEALSILKQSGLDIPFIIISGTIGEDVAVETMLIGVDDYLMKNNLIRLAPAIKRELENTANRRARQQADEALQRSEASLINAQRIARIGNFDWDIQNNQIFWSDEIYRMLNLPKGSIENSPKVIYNYIHPDDIQRVRSVTDAALSQAAPYEMEIRIIRSDGEERIVYTIGEVIFDELGKPLWLTSTVQDITERKLVDEEKTLLAAQLEHQHERLNNIIDNVSGVVWEAYGKPDAATQKIDFISDYVETMLGYTVEEWLSTPNFWLSIVHPEEQERIGRVAAENFLKSQSYTEEFRWVAKDGRIVWVEAHSTIICDEAGQPIGYRGVNIDITERKRAEHLIIESEERYRLLFDNSPLPMWVFDMETLAFLSVNEAAINHYGYSRQEFLTMSLPDIRLPEDIPILFESVAKDVPGIRNFGVVKHRKKDGTIIYAEIVTNQLIFEGRKAKLVLANDVTKRRKAEESVRFQARLLDVVEQAIIATDLDGNVIYWNQFAEKLYGWTAAEAVGRTIKELTTPEISMEQANQIMERLSAGASWAGEFVVQNKAGMHFPAYITNSPINDDTGKLVGIVGVSFDITERKNAETALREAEDKYRTLVESSPAIVYLAEASPPFAPIYISPNITKFGYTTEEWFNQPDMWINLIHEEDRENVLRKTEEAMEQGLDTDLKYRIVARDGSVHWLHDKGRFVTDNQEKQVSWQGVILDITETKELEERLRQSQKLESVGMLAGGIAHDFNNMLTVINGYGDLALRSLKDNDPLRRNIEEIKKAGLRSAALTHQLLAFSRQQVLQPVVLNINEIITDTIKMLKCLISEDIQITVALNPQTGRARVDPGQFSQIIMNLAVNARDAMPEGGKLSIETANVFLDPAYARQHPGVLPGAYILLSVCDTGSGMSDETREHIFEPFFTTKEAGHGTGLGLSTVYGIVKQLGGNIEVYSEQEVGTTFKIYLPRVAEQADAIKITDTSDERSAVTETILLIEDEEPVRNLTREILLACGYTVIEAGNGLEALEICEKRGCNFDLLMTDVVMPEMGGRELAEKLATRFPNLRILFTSGYTDDSVMHRGVIETNINFIQKPFTFETLAAKVRKLLNNPSC